MYTDKGPSKSVLSLRSESFIVQNPANTHIPFTSMDSCNSIGKQQRARNKLHPQRTN